MKSKFFFIAWMLLIPCGLLHGQEQQPLTESDKREILVRLGELRIARKELDLQRQHIARDEAQDKREADLHAKELQLSEQSLQVAVGERDLARETAEHYKTAYESVSKKGSGWCGFRKVITFGLIRCR